MKEETRAAHAALVGIGGGRTVNPPLERGSTILMPDAAALYADPSKETVYGLQGLTVQRTLTAAIAQLEGAEYACILPSGLAAMVAAIMASTKAGDEILVTDASYNPTRRFCDAVMSRFGVSTRYYAPDATAEEIAGMIGAATRLIVLEAPGSLTFDMVDIPAICALAREHGVLTLVDNSWGAAVLFKPLAHGADMSMQALSKYVGGHSDLLMGSVATDDPDLGKAIQAIYDDMGWFVSADEASLALRGLRTLHVRLKRHDETGRRLAAWLATRSEVSQVLHPALPDFRGHDLWKRDFSGANGLFGVVMNGGSRAAAEAMLDALTLFGIGFSWGGFESLAIYCDPQLKVRRKPPRFEGPLLRLHVGLEDGDDLIADLENGLAAFTGEPA